MIWQCTIPDYDLISPNRLMRMHFATRGRLHTVAVDLLTIFGDPIVFFDNQVDIEIIRQYGYRKRQMDEDNLYGACKIILDALRNPSPRSKKPSLGIIKDDSPNIIRTLSVKQEKSPDKTTRVLLKVSE